MALRGRSAEPADCLCLVGGHTPAILVHHTNGILRFHMTLLGRLFHPRESRLIVRWHAAPGAVQSRK